MNSKVLNATPEKRVFLSIIPEYDLERSICELIDNAIDLWAKSKRFDLKVEIIADQRQQVISIQDNAGGIEESKLDHIVSPGKTTNDIHDEGVGYFGVGSKRAVIALSQDIQIHSRFEHDVRNTIGPRSAVHVMRSRVAGCRRSRRAFSWAGILCSKAASIQ